MCMRVDAQFFCFLSFTIAISIHTHMIDDNHLPLQEKYINSIVKIANGVE